MSDKTPESYASVGEQPNTQKAGQTESIGVSGVRIASGYVIDEFINDLRGERGRKKYREMMDNDATVGALLTSIEMMLRAVDFRFEAAEEDIDRQYVDFAQEQFENMETSWDDTITEILSMLPFGFAILEMVFKKQDNYIVTAKLAPRSQETITEFDIDEHGDLRGVWQTPPLGGQRVYIPVSHLVHFKTRSNKGNPEGRSILRNAYRSYHFIKNIEMIEAIAIERELTGLPVVKIPAAAMQDAEVKQKYESMVRDVKLNEQGGIVLPSNPYLDPEGKPTSTPQYELQLLSASGSRAIDTNTVIGRHQQNLLRTVLADFMMLGASEKGSFALSKSKADLFLKSIEGYLKNICATLNESWVKKLWILNGFDPAYMPTLTCGNVAPIDLQELGNFIRDTGLMVVGDPETESFLHEVAGIPKTNESETLE